jgi:hypothetical protein
MLFENFERDITQMDKFVKDQHERLKQITEEANGLCEHFTVLNRAQQMIFGIDQLQKIESPAARNHSDGSEGDDFLARGSVDRSRNASLGSRNIVQELSFEFAQVVQIAYVAGTIDVKDANGL